MKKLFTAFLLFALSLHLTGQQSFSYLLRLNESGVEVKLPDNPKELMNPNTLETVYVYQDLSSTFIFQVSKIGRSLRDEPNVYEHADGIIEGFLSGFNAKLIDKENRYYKNRKCVDFSFKNDQMIGSARCLIYNKYIIAIVYFSKQYSFSDRNAFFGTLNFF